MRLRHEPLDLATTYDFRISSTGGRRRHENLLVRCEHEDTGIGIDLWILYQRLPRPVVRVQYVQILRSVPHRVLLPAPYRQHFHICHPHFFPK